MLHSSKMSQSAIASNISYYSGSWKIKIHLISIMCVLPSNPAPVSSTLHTPPLAQTYTDRQRHRNKEVSVDIHHQHSCFSLKQLRPKLKTASEWKLCVSVSQTLKHYLSITEWGNTIRQKQHFLSCIITPHLRKVSQTQPGLKLLR